MERRVVISGLGLIAPGAQTVNEFWNNLRNNVTSISKITKCDTGVLKVKIGGQITTMDAVNTINRRFLIKCDDFSIYSLLAVKQAMDDAKLNMDDIDSEKIGIYIGNNSGGWKSAESGLIDLHNGGVDAVNTYLATNWFPAAPQGHVSIYYKFKGYSKTVVGDMASGNIAIGNAYNLIKNGKVDYMIAGGTENLIVKWGLIFYQQTGMLSPENTETYEKAYQPFGKSRSGLVLAEGAGYVVLELLESALKRHASIYGEICGYGITNDGYHFLKGNPDGRQYARAVKAALNSNSIPDFISLNGSAVLNEDDSEINGLNLVFGENINKVTCSCPKSFYGHAFGAAGGLDIITVCLCMKNDIIIKSGNITEKADNVNFDYVMNEHRKKPVNSSLVINKGLGGINSALYIKNI